MNNKLDSYQLQNGMILLGEHIENAHSVSFQFLLPAGTSLLPEGCCGAGNVLCDWLFRGTRNRSSRELVEALDQLGIHRNAAASVHHLGLSASLEASNLTSALELYAEIILKPLLAKEQFELSRQLAINELQGLDDDPRQKTMILLCEQFYPDPFGRPGIGHLDQLQKLSPSETAKIAKKMIDPSKIIFSICGNYDFGTVCSQIEDIFSIEGNNGLPEASPAFNDKPYLHSESEGAQVHIGLMTPTPTMASENYYEIAAAVSILSGSMSSRLFTEVREKRGLCYAVGANYRTQKDYAGISCYAGTTPDKAQQTLDVILEQFHNLKDDISEDELQRGKTGLKTSLVMQGESTSARSSSIATDYFLLGRVRSLSEIRDRISALSVDSILEFLRKHPFEDFTVVTIGPNSVTV